MYLYTFIFFVITCLAGCFTYSFWPPLFGLACLMAALVYTRYSEGHIEFKMAHAVLNDSRKKHSPEKIAQAIERLKNAAMKRSSRAQTYLGLLYLNGDHGVEQSDALAAKWIGYAARQYLPVAQNLMGALYYAGRGVPQDYAAARTYFGKAAKKGNPQAISSLAAMCMSGLGGEKDYSTAVTLYEKALTLGDKKAAAYLAQMYRDGGYGIEKDEKQSLEYFTVATEAGDVIAAYNLFYHYKLGPVEKRDPEKALKWLTAAAEGGYATAQFFMADYYLNATPPDNQKSFVWQMKAAEQGMNAAMQLLARSYSQGIGVEKDSAKALEWLRKASAFGNSNAMHDIGIMYANGEGGLTQDYHEANSWYRKAIEKDGNKFAYLSLGRAYQYGYGVDTDYTEALRLYKCAAEKGLPPAYKALGTAYFEGSLAQQDYAEAHFWFSLAEGDDGSNDINILQYLSPEQVTEINHRLDEWHMSHRV